MHKKLIFVLLAIARTATAGLDITAGKGKEKEKEKDKGPPIDPATSECHMPFRPATNVGTDSPSEQQLQTIHDAIVRYQGQLGIYRECLGRKEEVARKANDVTLVNAMTKAYNDSVDTEEQVVSGFNLTLHKGPGKTAPASNTSARTNGRVASSSKSPNNNSADSSRYQRCLNQIPLNAQAAIEAALTWAGEGGGAPAKHCHALALIASGQAQDGAVRLEALAKARGSHDNGLRVEMLQQAGDAWLVSGNAHRAVADFRSAVDLSRAAKLPASARAGTLNDLADAYILSGDNKSARTSLDAAIAIQPTADAYTTRARSLREAKDAKSAQADIDRALALDPKNAEALLERGRLRMGSGNTQGARDDFLNASMIAKNGPVAESAQRELQTLDIR